MTEETEHRTSRRVLVVSDDQDVGRFLGRVLEDAGLEVVTCPVDDIAIELASSFPAFDVVLGDSISPAVVGRVRNLADPDRAATPVVVLAPYDAADGDADIALTAGASSFLTRPIAEHEVVDGVHAVMLEEALEPDQSDSPSDDDG